MKNGAISKADGTTFEILTKRVKDVHNATSSIAKSAVNQLLTIRNWAIGCYIVEYEQEGCDRAKYGVRLLQNLAVIKKKIREAICETVSRKFETPPELLVTRLSFSHIKEIMPIEDPIERFFYELECIKGTWMPRMHST